MSDSLTPWIAARQASLSITTSRSSLNLTSIESVMPSNHLILCRPLLLLPLIPPSIRVFSNESTVRMRWPKYWSFSFSIIPWQLQTQEGGSKPCPWSLLSPEAAVGRGWGIGLWTRPELAPTRRARAVPARCLPQYLQFGPLVLAMWNSEEGW